MNLTDLEKVRQDRLSKIVDLGFDPYGRVIQGIDSIKSIIAQFTSIESSLTPDQISSNNIQDRKPIAQGRIVLLRDNGGLIWLKIRDESGEIQVAISKKDVINEKTFQLAKLLDLGDIITVQGNIRRTKTQEITIWAHGVTIACKSLSHPPDKHAGIQDVETRYRQRYLDMAFNSEFINVLKTRSKIINLFRKEFEEINFTEVETPMLHSIAGGAAARPFQTHLNALGIPLFLRVAPELYLKKLIVGGMNNVFEINRNFRNEGIDATHNPEFTALEAYSTSHNASTLMVMVETIIRSVASIIRSEDPVNDLIFEYNGHKINLHEKFQVVAYSHLYKKATGRNIQEDADDLISANKRFEQLAEPLIDPTIPTFVYGYPCAISPLTKAIIEQPLFAQRADLFIGGMEIGTIYTEQNDPKIQHEVFSNQVSNDDEESTHRTMDDDFIEALKVGMPPTGGLGIGIDRLVMIFTGQTSVRDVIAFPFMRPKNSSV